MLESTRAASPPFGGVRVLGGCKTAAAGSETAAKRLQRGARPDEHRRRWHAPPWVRCGRGTPCLALRKVPQGQTSLWTDRRTAWPSTVDRRAANQPSPLDRAGAVRGLDCTSLKGGRMPRSAVTSTTSTRVGSLRVHDRDGGASPRTPGGPRGVGPGEAPWVTKRQLADHLQVTPRWIELQHPQGLPHLRRGGIVRYRISDVEAWLLASTAAGGA